MAVLFLYIRRVSMYEDKEKIEMPDLLEIDEIKSDAELLINELHDVRKIDSNLYVEYDVKRGLRDSNGKGVLTGLTEVSDVVAFDIKDGDKVPCDGRLYYQGINVMDIVTTLETGSMVLRRFLSSFFSDIYPTETNLMHIFMYQVIFRSLVQDSFVTLL